MYHEVPIDVIYERFELLHINHEHCPRDEKHLGIIVDGAGRTRCSQRSVRRLRPSFIVEDNAGYDELSQMEIRDFYERGPMDPGYYDENGEVQVDPDEERKYLRVMERFESEEPTQESVDVCYAIISDRGVVLPFETILRRLNLAPPRRTVYCGNDMFRPCKKLNEVDEHLRDDYSLDCRGHEEPVKQVVFPFDGWDLAYYLQRWREQSANPPWFSEKKEDWPLKRQKIGQRIAEFED